jgi:hypothetical protein
VQKTRLTLRLKGSPERRAVGRKDLIVNFEIFDLERKSYKRRLLEEKFQLSLYCKQIRRVAEGPIGP